MWKWTNCTSTHLKAAASAPCESFFYPVEVASLFLCVSWVSPPPQQTRSSPPLLHRAPELLLVKWMDNDFSQTCQGNFCPGTGELATFSSHSSSCGIQIRCISHSCCAGVGGWMGSALTERQCELMCTAHVYLLTGPRSHGLLNLKLFPPQWGGLQEGKQNGGQQNVLTCTLFKDQHIQVRLKGHCSYLLLHFHKVGDRFLKEIQAAEAKISWLL